MSSTDDILTVKKILSKFRPSLIHDPRPYIPTSRQITYGTFAGMVAASLVHPFDVIKTRLQVNPYPYTTYFMMRRIIRLQGFLTLYKGFTAALYRQLFNTGTRLYCYDCMYERFRKKYKRNPILREKVGMGLVAGVIGAFMGNPSEVILVRMMASSAPRAFNKCPDLQDLINRRYLDFGDALQRIISEEGVKALWRGGTLTVFRSILATCSQIGAYGIFRDFFQRQNVPEGYFLHVISAMLSSALFSVISIPVDVVKTRYQMKRRGVTMPQIFHGVVQKRGPFYFWQKPLPAYYFRATFHTLSSFFVIQAIENTYDKEEMEWQKKNRNT